MIKNTNQLYLDRWSTVKHIVYTMFYLLGKDSLRSKDDASFISACWINCSLRHPSVLMLISLEQKALIKCTACAIINIGFCKGTGEVFFTNLSQLKFTLHKDMNLQIHSKCPIWHFLYATQQNQAYMINYKIYIYNINKSSSRNPNTFDEVA